MSFSWRREEPDEPGQLVAGGQRSPHQQRRPVEFGGVYHAVEERATARLGHVLGSGIEAPQEERPVPTDGHGRRSLVVYPPGDVFRVWRVREPISHRYEAGFETFVGLE